MSQQLSLLIILAMVGSLCGYVWSLSPEMKVKQAQEVRIKAATHLIYH
ncbi:hypothetical protein ACQCN2_21105 [Brevibacillus ginsengisoli]